MAKSTDADRDDGRAMFESPLGSPFDEPEPEVEDDEESEEQPDPVQLQSDLRIAQQREQDANRARERSDELLRQALATPSRGSSQTQQSGAATADEINLSQAPDPVSDREGYNRWVAQQIRRVQLVSRAEVSALQQRLANMEQGGAADRHFDAFVRAYPQFADKRALVERAAETAGVRVEDPQERIFSETIRVLEEWGVPVEKGARRKDARRAAVAASGERPSGRRRSRDGDGGEFGLAKGEKAPMPFDQQLAEVQAESGLY